MLKMYARFHLSVAWVTSLLIQMTPVEYMVWGWGGGPGPSSLPGKNEDLSLDP